MRRPIRKELMARFPAEFERRVPGFVRVSRKQAGNDPLWALRLSPKLTFFIRLQPVSNDDQFYVEIAWSHNGKFPWGNLDGVEAIEAPTGRERLPRLYDKSVMDPPWAIVPEPTRAESEALMEAFHRGERDSFLAPEPPVEEVLPRVGPLVEDAVQKIVKYALPYFRRVAAHRGLAWPPSKKPTVDKPRVRKVR